MASVIQICNRALGRVGNSRTMNSLTERTKEAATCSLFFEDMRDAVLSDFDWNFALTRVALADLGTPPPDWQYSYAYPSDCMRATELFMPGKHLHGMRSPKIIFETAANSDGNGRVILTNQPQAWLLYVRRITDPTMFDAIFSDALAWRLAAEIAMPITGNANLGTAAQNRYTQVIASAGAHSMNEAQEEDEPMSDIARARLC
jgi:hypothetical protein